MIQVAGSNVAEITIIHVGASLSRDSITLHEFGVLVLVPPKLVSVHRVLALLLLGVSHYELLEDNSQCRVEVSLADQRIHQARQIHFP